MFCNTCTSLIHDVDIYKGHVAPSSTDHGSSGNIIVDFYWVSIFCSTHEDYFLSFFDKSNNLVTEVCMKITLLSFYFILPFVFSMKDEIGDTR